MQTVRLQRILSHKVTKIIRRLQIARGLMLSFDGDYINP